MYVYVISHFSSQADGNMGLVEGDKGRPTGNHVGSRFFFSLIFPP